MTAYGLSSLKAFDPVEPIVRYEREAPGELLHMDTKKLGCIVRPSHRVTGNRRDCVDGAGWEVAHVAIDDHSRAGFVQMHLDERKESAVEFRRATVAHYKALGIKHTLTKPYRPQTIGKAERFIQTCLREWAYGRIWANSAERTAWLPGLLQRPQTPFSLRLHPPQPPYLAAITYCNLTQQFYSLAVS